MGDDAIAEPSLLLARHENAHREHHIQHRHHRAHEQRQATAVVEVVATVSVVQQINVDTNGNTFAIQTFLADSTGGVSPTLLTDDGSSPTTPNPPIQLTTNATPTLAAPVTGTSLVSFSAASLQSLITSPGASTDPALSLSTSTGFASLVPTSNTTTLISSSSSLTLSNSSSATSTSSSTRSSLTSFTSSSSSFTRSSSSTSSTSSFYFPTFSDSPATSTGANGLAGGATGVPNPGPITPADSDTATNSNDSGPSVPTVVGSVVGSVAGLAIILVALLYLWRWKKRGAAMLPLDSGDRGVDNVHDAPPSLPAGGMAQRKSLANFVPAALASLTGQNRTSQRTEKTVSSTAGSEKGFYRVSGRKLPSVFQHGGDGYGGPSIPEGQTLSGASFYRDSQGFYGGPGSPSSPGLPVPRDSGIPIMRPSPARTPVTEQPPFTFPEPPPQLHTPTRDVLGRSHPSHDGSHTSRFTEEV